MTYRYYPDTDSLYIELLAATGADAYELQPDVVVDVDEYAQIVGFDIQHASQHLGGTLPNSENVERLQQQLLKVAALVLSA